MGKRNILILACLSLVSCGGKGGATPIGPVGVNSVASIEDARKIYRAMQSVHNQTGALTGVSGTQTCPEGGTARAEVSYEGSTPSISIHAKIEYLGCAAEGIRLDGQLDEDATVGSSVGSSGQFASSSASNEGYVTTTLGGCVIDFNQTLTASSTGFSAEVTGTFCGFDAQAVLGA